MRKYRIRHYCGTGVWQQRRMRRERLIRPTVGHRLSHCRSDKMRKYRIRHYCGTGVWQQRRMRRERLIRPTVGHRLSHCRSDKMRKHRIRHYCGTGVWQQRRMRMKVAIPYYYELHSQLKEMYPEVEWIQVDNASAAFHKVKEGELDALVATQLNSPYRASFTLLLT